MPLRISFESCCENIFRAALREVDGLEAMAVGLVG